MFKKIIIAIAIAIALPVVANAQKFGVVDAQAVLQAMPEFATAQTELGESQKKLQEELKKLEEEVNKKYQEYQALPEDTPASIKDRRLQDVQDMAQKAQQFQQTAGEDLQRQEQQKMAPLQQKLMDAIKAVGQEGNYTFIFHEGTDLYHGADVKDVTPDVKAKLGIK